MRCGNQHLCQFRCWPGARLSGIFSKSFSSLNSSFTSVYKDKAAGKYPGGKALCILIGYFLALLSIWRRLQPQLLIFLVVQVSKCPTGETSLCMGISLTSNQCTNSLRLPQVTIFLMEIYNVCRGEVCFPLIRTKHLIYIEISLYSLVAKEAIFNRSTYT